MKFSFDKSRVPTERLFDPRLLEAERVILAAMKDPRARILNCLHEAAHGAYYRRAGAKGLIYHGLFATYDEKTDSFQFGELGIQADFGSPGVVNSMIEVARYYVAGGVAVRRLTSSPDGRDSQDRNDFFSFVRSREPSMGDEESRDAGSKQLRTLRKICEIRLFAKNYGNCQGSLMIGL